jgi:hypothetical protein
MRIKIEYESSWRNSFLDGDNNQPLPKKGRDFICSLRELQNEGHYIPRQITLSTVMGVLNRLIGDQRKLYQSRATADYYFLDIEPRVKFTDKPSFVSNEIIYIRNMKGSTDQNAFTGMIKVNDPIFLSDYSNEFWGVLNLDFDNLCEFILNNQYQVSDSVKADPISVISRLEVINKEKTIDSKGDVQLVHDCLKKTFEGQNYLNSKGSIKPINFYCSALYIQLARLESRFDMTSAKTVNGKISGISKAGFTKKDFMNRYTTGDKKIIWGNPYIKKERIKGEGEVTSILTKASGGLTININIDTQQARDLKNKIDAAAVSSFYLGKKGLAYITEIRI